MFLWINSTKKKPLMVQLHNFFWPVTTVVPIISSILEKSKYSRSQMWRECTIGRRIQLRKIIPNLAFSWRISIPNSIFHGEFGHITCKSKRPREKFPKYLLQFMGKSCQAQDYAHSLHLLEPSEVSCSLKLCQNSKYILNFIYCGPLTPALEVQLFSYCSNARNWMGFPLSPT